MKKIPLTVLITLKLLSFGIFLWSIWPTPIVEKGYPINLEQPIFKDVNCNPGLYLDTLSFQVVYPKFQNRKGIATIQVNMQKSWLNRMDPPKNCGYQVEVSFNMVDSFTHPQNRIFQSLMGESAQSFQFEVMPANKQNLINGDLWVYLISDSKQFLSQERLPILVVPVSIPPRIFFGISGNLTMLTSLASFFALFAVAVIMRKPE